MYVNQKRMVVWGSEIFGSSIMLSWPNGDGVLCQKRKGTGRTFWSQSMG